MASILKKRNGVKFEDLRDGQLVEIISVRNGDRGDVGKVAQRVEDDKLLIIGESEYESFIMMDQPEDPNELQLRFRILENGETIEVTDNE
jgi:hypothetical protein